MRLTAGQSESLSVFTASVPSGTRRQKYSGIRNDSGNFVYLVSCTTVSLRPDCQAANLSLVIVTIAILSMISCPRFQKRCKGTAFFRTRKLFTKFFLPRPGRAELSERNQSGPDTGTFRAPEGSFAMVSDLRGQFRLQIGENENLSQRVIFYAAEHIFAKMRAFLGLTRFLDGAGVFGE